MKTTIDIPEPVLRRTKQLAAERGIAVSDVVVDALRDHSTSKPEAHEPFRLHTVRGRVAKLDLGLNRTSELLVQDDESDFTRREDN